MTKAERKEAWIDQIKTAKYMANEAIEKIPLTVEPVILTKP